MIMPRHAMASSISRLLILLGLVRSLSADAHPSPLETMADVTNDFGVCVLQIIASPNVNTVFSPYGLMSMALLVYEGTRGQAAAEIYNTLHLPWHRDIVRIGFRDLHRYLRSYFSSEGFLKGLVLSKPNVTLRESYIEVLKFYGFQSDTAITLPVFTTQASVGNREGNETTTSLPDLTTQVQTTPMTTTRPKTTKPEESSTVIPTTVMTTPDILMGTNKPQTQPDILSMQGSEEGKTTVPPTTTILTTIVSEPTKRETSATESIKPQETTMGITKEPPINTTVEETKEEETTANEMPTTNQVTKESKTESLLPEMDVVTMTNPTPTELKSMNMMLINKTEESENKIPDVTLGDFENETEVNQGKTTISEFVSVITNEITTREVFTEQAETETVTLFIDRTLPIEEVTLLSTPPDVEVFTDKDSPMFEAVVLMEQSAPQVQNIELTTDGSTNKRSTDSEFEKEPPKPENTKPHSNLYSILHKNNGTENTDQYNNEHESWNIGERDQVLVDSVINNLIEDTNNINISHQSVDTSKETMAELNNLSQFNDSDLIESPGLPTLEPDLIIFPTSTESRIPRAVKYDEKPQPAAGTGNWVGSSGWHPSPTDQWFWTFTGDKLVPVLTYTAFLPYADLPTLRATALQLPLDDVRYTLIILLPKNARGLKQLLQSLQWCPLRSILKQFKPTPVYAVVPTFTIVKHINLTPALHKLGVRNIFDGYQANLCEMSDEPNLYVRSVEQVITISVRKYFTNQNWIEASPTQVEQHFLATHPFVYFVVDVETKVALVAGTVVDPMERSS